MTSATPSPAPSWKVWGALSTVYVLWGSSYLAIRWAVETLPPFLMAGARFLTAGAMLYAAMRARGEPRPTATHWRSATLVGVLLLVGGNGGVVWAEQRVESGMAAVLVATLPLWLAVLQWFGGGGERPSGRTWVGLLAGLGGVALLVGPQPDTAHAVDPTGAGVLLLASLSWAIGSLRSRTAALPASSLLGTAMQMLAGGAVLALLGVSTGELGRMDLAAASVRSWASLAYLVLFGSLAGFSAYIWVLRAAPPSLVSTYAYVNPVVAVFLGWAVADEPVTGPRLVAAAIVVGSVALIVGGRKAAPASRRA